MLSAWICNITKRNFLCFPSTAAPFHVTNTKAPLSPVISESSHDSEASVVESDMSGVPPLSGKGLEVSALLFWFWVVWANTLYFPRSLIFTLSLQDDDDEATSPIERTSSAGWMRSKTFARESIAKSVDYDSVSLVWTMTE